MITKKIRSEAESEKQNPSGDYICNDFESTVWLMLFFNDNSLHFN